MFRVLKEVRMQEIIGEFPANKHKLLTFAVACIAAANQCDNNMKGRPLFAKSLAKATYIATNFELLDLSGPAASGDATTEASAAATVAEQQQQQPRRLLSTELTPALQRATP